MSSGERVEGSNKICLDLYKHEKESYPICMCCTFLSPAKILRSLCVLQTSIISFVHFKVLTKLYSTWKIVKIRLDTGFLNTAISDMLA